MSSLKYGLIITVKGTGIQLYNVIRAQINISVTVDTGSSRQYSISNSSCYNIKTPTAAQGCYNMSVYNLQSLTFGVHSLGITMLSYLGQDTVLSDYCDFFFDYAVISSPSTASGTSQNQRTQYVPLYH